MEQLDVTQISIILAEDPLSDNGVCCMNDMQQMSSNLGEACLYELTRKAFATT